MQGWTDFSTALNDWRESPVTEVMRQAMAKVIQRRKDQLESLFWAGKGDELEMDRRVLLMVEEWAEDFFAASAEDVAAIMDDGK